LNTLMNNRILHVDGDSFFASCEIALAMKAGRDLRQHPVWVGGGRRGDGIVIAANRVANPTSATGAKKGMWLVILLGF
jgi:nucleotidyltransferase/DNA polymerase involved in DNA repair